MTVLELYNQTIKSLPTAERFRLAKLILNDIPAQSLVDYRDVWTDEDYSHFTTAGWTGVGDAPSPELPHLSAKPPR